MKVYILLSILFTFVLCTECPNGCSGHGICSSNSECICNRQVGVGLNQGDFEEFSYTGADCSERLCPKGGSYSATQSESWWEVDSETYKAYFLPKGCFGVKAKDPEGSQSDTITIGENYKYVGNRYILIEGDVPEITTYRSGGIVNCYEEQTASTLVGSYRIYTTANDVNSKYTVLIGEAINETTDEIKNYWKPNPDSNPTICEKNDEGKQVVYYCKAVRTYRDISLLAALPINTEETTKEKAGNWTFEGKDEDGNDKTDINYAHLYYSYFGTVTDRPINVLCPKKSGEMQIYQTNITTTADSPKYTVTINKVPDTYGNCFLLYSPVNGNLDETTSEIRYLIGKENKFGDKVDDSAFIWKKAGEKVFDLTKTLLTIKQVADDKKIVLDNRDSSIGEIKNSLSDGSAALMYRIDLYSKEPTTLNPIRNQIVHIGKNSINKNELTLSVIEDVDETIMCDDINTTPTPSTADPDCTNTIIGLQLFQEGPHGAVECSGVGECDRQTGKCQCPVGYQGSACQRTSCPNNCSGKGKCVVSKGNDMYGDDIIYKCECDGGFRGSDCSKFECPSKEDPKKATNTNDKDEFRDCSGRGICDYETGLCSCFEGYSGEACDKITSIY